MIFFFLMENSLPRAGRLQESRVMITMLLPLHGLQHIYTKLLAVFYK